MKVLDPQRAIRNDPVELLAAELTRHRFEVAGAADPLAVPCGAAKCARETRRIAYVRRAARDRREGRCEREQVQVVVVQAREQRAACRVEHGLAATPLDHASDLGDRLIGNPHVERRGAADLGVRDQHGARRPAPCEGVRVLAAVAPAARPRSAREAAPRCGAPPGASLRCAARERMDTGVYRPAANEPDLEPLAGVRALDRRLTRGGAPRSGPRRRVP